MKLVLILLSCISNSWTQYPAFFRPHMNGNFYGTEFMDFLYMQPSRYPIRSSGTEYNNPYYNYEEYPESEECVCSCSECDRPTPCCLQMCLTCNQPNVVIMPYPYPLIESTTPNLQSTTTTLSTTTPTTVTTQATTTTTQATTTTTQPTTILSPNREALNDMTNKDAQKVINDVDIDNIMRFPQRSDHKYILTTLRRTKADWKPKYGIVPIPERLAESLMSQLRNMKEIKK